MTQKTLFVGGTFDESEGRYSEIGNIIFKSAKLGNADYCNGGLFSKLERIAERINEYNLVFWLAKTDSNISSTLKQKSNSFILVSSIRNIEKRHSLGDLLQHSLRIKSNLLIEFTAESGVYYSRILDPLGNVFLDYSDDMKLVGKVMAKRAEELAVFSRIGSEKIGDSLEVKADEEFFMLIRSYAETFHSLVHLNDSPCRFMGNASFRCESGFPSYKDGNLIYVSKRNNDKRMLNSESFVPVKLELPVKYFGNEKPSVDTPIQVMLYQHYENVKYMLHSHVYIRNAGFVEKIIPCGALEEAVEIVTLFPDKNKKDFAVNLKGHGSLFLASDLRSLKQIDYISRPMPEIHVKYLEDLK